MAHLCVNIDHIATLRQARRDSEPDPVVAAMLVEQTNASGITVHLREDRRHIQDRDVAVLRQTVKTKLNLEMAATDEMVEIACRIKPDECTIVPEKRQELTTEGGLDVKSLAPQLRASCCRLRDAGIVVSLFVDPEAGQLQAAKQVGADFVELHTGKYAAAIREAERTAEWQALVHAANQAQELGLRINAGHGLNYRNVRPVAAIPGVEDLNIGFAIIARAALVGLDQAVRDMLVLLQ